MIGRAQCVEDVDVVVGGEGGIDGDRVEALVRDSPLPRLVICRNGVESSCVYGGNARRTAPPSSPTSMAPPGRNAIVVGRLSPVVEDLVLEVVAGGEPSRRQRTAVDPYVVE